MDSVAKFSGMAVGIASSGRKVDLRWALAQPVLAWPVGMSVAWLVRVGPDRAQNREVIAEKAVEIGAPFLFFIDDDTVCPNFAARALHHELSQHPDAAICGGIYCTKEEPPSPIVFKELGGGPHWQWKVGEVFECAGLGAGAMMIRTEFLPKIPKPWFFEPDVAPVSEVTNIGGLQVPLAREAGTDDLYFCKKVSDAGLKILAHGGVLPVHIGEDGKEYSLPPNSYPMQPREVQEVVCQ